MFTEKKNIQRLESRPNSWLRQRPKSTGGHCHRDFSFVLTKYKRRRMEWWKSRRKQDSKYGNRPETRRLRPSANGLVRLNRQLYGRNGFSVSRSRWHTRVAYRPLKTPETSKTPEAPTRAGKEMAIRCFFFFQSRFTFQEDSKLSFPLHEYSQSA